MNLQEKLSLLLELKKNNNQIIETADISVFKIGNILFTTENLKEIFLLSQNYKENRYFPKDRLSITPFLFDIHHNHLNSTVFTEDFYMFVIEQQKVDNFRYIPFDKITNELNKMHSKFLLDNSKNYLNKSFLSFNYLHFSYKEFHSFFTQYVDNIFEDKSEFEVYDYYTDMYKSEKLIEDNHTETFKLLSHSDFNKNYLKFRTYIIKILKEKNPNIIKFFLSFNSIFSEYIIENSLFEILEKKDIIFINPETQNNKMLAHFRPLNDINLIVHYIIPELVLEPELEVVLNKAEEIYSQNLERSMKDEVDNVLDYLKSVFSLSEHNNSLLTTEFYLSIKEKYPLSFKHNLFLIPKEVNIDKKIYFSSLIELFLSKKKFEFISIISKDETKEIVDIEFIKEFLEIGKNIPEERAYNRFKYCILICFIEANRNSDWWIISKETEEFISETLKNMDKSEDMEEFYLKHGSDKKKWGIITILDFIMFEYKILNPFEENDTKLYSIKDNSIFINHNFKGVVTKHIFKNIMNYSEDLIFSNIIDFTYPFPQNIIEDMKIALENKMFFKDTRMLINMFNISNRDTSKNFSSLIIENYSELNSDAVFYVLCREQHI